MVRQPTVISLFAGCGGSSLGYQMAGFRELLAVEWDKNAAATFRLNFPEIPIYEGDIAALSGAECLRLAGVNAGELDLLDGSPPCQGFSIAGKRRLADPRNSLFEEYARLIQELRPKVFVMENVTGMVKGHMKQVYRIIVKTLRDCGYQVKGEILNAMYFGVPQSRERVILIGIRSDLGTQPSLPKPQMRPRTVQEAIGYLPQGIPEKHQPQVISTWYKANRYTGRRVRSFHSVRLDPYRPSPTQLRAHLHWHWVVPRQLTIQEAAILQSFPESWQFVGPKAKAKEQIGNSVPPLMMKAIATHIRERVFDG